MRETKSLADGLAGHRNSLGLIRLVLAVSVIVSHSFVLGGYGQEPLLGLSRGQLSLGTLAVVGFFAISGYLVTVSGMRLGGIRFLWNRVLRLIPAFWTLLLVTAFVVGPYVAWRSGDSLRYYFSNHPGGVFHYLGNNWLLHIQQYGIDKQFLTDPWGRSGHGVVANGSIWTLIHEFHCYVLIAVFAFAAQRWCWRALLPMMLVVVVTVDVVLFSAGKISPLVMFPAFANSAVTPLVVAFIAGACLAAYGDVVPLDDRLGWTSLVVCLYTLHRGGFMSIGVIAMAYVILWAACRLPQQLHRIGAVNDYSYAFTSTGSLSSSSPIGKAGHVGATCRGFS